LRALSLAAGAPPEKVIGGVRGPLGLTWYGLARYPATGDPLVSMNERDDLPARSTAWPPRANN
jgi:hypothetical protein